MHGILVSRMSSISEVNVHYVINPSLSFFLGCELVVTLLGSIAHEQLHYMGEHIGSYIKGSFVNFGKALDVCKYI